MSIDYDNIDLGFNAWLAQIGAAWTPDSDTDTSCDGDEDCGGTVLTPRTAAFLAALLDLMGDRARTELDYHPDGQAVDDTWDVLADYPPITWRQSNAWRKQAVQAFTALSDDLHAGRTPEPRTPAQEMAPCTSA